MRNKEIIQTSYFSYSEEQKCKNASVGISTSISIKWFISAVGIVTPLVFFVYLLICLGVNKCWIIERFPVQNGDRCWVHKPECCHFIWASWRLKWSATRMFVPRPIQAKNKEYIKPPALLALCKGNPRCPVDSPLQKASDAEKVSMWWRHYVHVPVDQTSRSQTTYELMVEILWDYRLLK